MAMKPTFFRDMTALAAVAVLGACEVSTRPASSEYDGASAAPSAGAVSGSAATRSLAPVDPSDLIVNGSFESNSGGTTFAGWNEFNSGNGNWVVQSGPSSVGFAPPDGTYGAMSTQGGPGTHILYQDVTLPPQGATLSFSIASRTFATFRTPASLLYTTYPNQQFRVDVVDPANAITTISASDVMLYRTNTGDPTNFAFKRVSYDLAAFGGQTVRLRFTEVDNQGNFYFGLDYVTLIPNAPLDNTAPVITPDVAGTLGDNGWYTSDVTVSWNVSDPETPVTSPACVSSSVTSDVASASFSCSATSTGGTSSETVTVKRDATAPVVAFGGNAGSYTVDQTIAITCTAADAMSGIATSSCPEASGAAYEFALGANLLSAAATDLAGNTTSASATFSVTVDAESLCALVERFVSQKGVANSLCVKLRNGATRAFLNEVRAQSGKFVPADKAAILSSLAGAL